MLAIDGYDVVATSIVIAGCSVSISVISTAARFVSGDVDWLTAALQYLPAHLSCEKCVANKSVAYLGYPGVGGCSG